MVRFRDYYDLLFTSSENDYIYENRPMLVEIEEQSLWDIGFGQAGFAVRLGTWSARGKAAYAPMRMQTSQPVHRRPSPTRVRAIPIFDSQRIQSALEGYIVSTFLNDGLVPA